MRSPVSGRCRACLVRVGVRPLLDATATPSPAAMLALLLDAPVAADDALPKTVCDECLRRIRDAYRFRLECLRVQSALSTLLDGASDDVAIDDELARGLLGEEPPKPERPRPLEAASPRRRRPESNAPKRARILPKEDARPDAGSRARVCSVCDFAFDSAASLTLHNLKVHFPSRPDGRFQCDACEKVYKHKYVLSRHERKAHASEPKTPCEKCGFACATLSELRVHQKSNCDDPPARDADGGRVACKFCDKSFSGIKNLALHVRTHSSNVCRYCNQGFVDDHALIAHVSKHANHRNPYFCVLCAKTFSMKKTLLRHQRFKHGTDREQFFCGYCSSPNFVDAEALRMHLRSSHSELTRFSDKCAEKSALAPAHTKRHGSVEETERIELDNKHNGEAERPIELNEKTKYIISYLIDEPSSFYDTSFKELTDCVYNGDLSTAKTDDCPASDLKMLNRSPEKCVEDLTATVSSHNIIKDMSMISFDSINTMNHEETVMNDPAAIENENDKIIIFSDMNVADIENSIQNFEQNEIITIKKETCNPDKLCSPSFTSLSEEQNNDIEDVGEQGKEFNATLQCTVCCKKFIRLFNLQKHMTSHKTEIPYCIGCSFVAKNHDELKDHLRQCRSLLKSGNLICVYCDKKLTTTAGLRYHLRTHLMTRQFSCSLCQKCFLTHSNLKVHFKTMHSRTRSYMCSSCPRAFATNNHLQKHITAAHTGQRNYVCTTCGRKFMQSSHLTQHMWTHTGIKPHCCPYCPNKYTAKCSLRNHLQRNHRSEKNQEETLLLQQNESIKDIVYCSSIINTDSEIAIDHRIPIFDETDDESDKVNVVVVVETSDSTTENIVNEYEQKKNLDLTT